MILEGYGRPRICESTTNYWIVVHDMLEDAGIHPAGPPAQHEDHNRITVYKNDKADSAKLADLCRLDMIPESFVADKPRGTCAN